MLSCANGATASSTYKWCIVTNPFLVQVLKDPSIIEGLNTLLLGLEALIYKLLRDSTLLNRGQAFKDCLTTVLAAIGDKKI